MNADFDAQTLLVAVSDNTPVIATINDGEFAGRPVGGNVGTVTAAQALTMLGIGDAAALLHATAALVGTAANTTTTGPFYDATNRGGYQRVTGDGDSGTGQVVYLWRVPPDFAGWDTTMLSVGHIWADATGNNVGSLVIIDTAGVTVETAAVTATATYVGLDRAMFWTQARDTEKGFRQYSANPVRTTSRVTSTVLDHCAHLIR